MRSLLGFEVVAVLFFSRRKMSSPSSLLSQYLTYSSPNRLDISMGPSNEEQHFCTEENVLECAVYLSKVVHYQSHSQTVKSGNETSTLSPPIKILCSTLQELETLGTGPIIDHDEPDLVRLLNATHDVLQYYRATVKKFEDINVRYVYVYIYICKDIFPIFIPPFCIAVFACNFCYYLQ